MDPLTSRVHRFIGRTVAVDPPALSAYRSIGKLTTVDLLISRVHRSIGTTATMDPLTSRVHRFTGKTTATDLIKTPDGRSVKHITSLLKTSSFNPAKRPSVARSYNLSQRLSVKRVNNRH
ncbi:hypothetical protein DEO72_LG10g1728 [Vigna unguiculata]|uniref:Uncharacterized protein n=1 Tax=Vigna unguiculata TaxID=3917 RepID=A0A4D6NF10_VIGUN|nr:hypothetical protein DEO72_LG10g1727 [Vigna unguiculata]QCE10498.1 hypothetical protein DEO72_LG10g1728 [Vigna unguiculata]